MGNLTDKQLARVVHSVKFMQDYGSMVSSSNSANQSSGAWISHMVEWLKKILKGLLNVQWRNIWTMSKPLSFKIFRSSFYHGALFVMVKNWPNNDKIVFGKHEIFTKALAKINFENHKELTMNEVHVTTAKVVLISLISGAAVALITHLFLKSQLKN